MGAGGGRVGAGVSGYWVLDRLCEGLGAHEVCKLAEEQIERNELQFHDVRVVYGVQVHHRVEIVGATYLCPPDELPADHYRNTAFASRVSWRDELEDCAALVQPYILAPVLFHRDDQVAINQKHERILAAAEMRREFANKVRFSLALASNGAISIPKYYETADARNILCQGAGMFSPLNSPYIFQHLQVDEAAVRVNLEALERFRPQDAIMLACDRLIRSRAPGDLADRMMDLGVALEVLMMHGAGSENQEINYKLRTRAGWLLGRDPNERDNIAKIAKALYEARSRAAHRGHVRSDTFATRLPEFDDLIFRLIRELLIRGTFPNWDILTFGGAG